MLALPLFVTTLALAPTGGSSRLELGAAGQFDATAVSLPAPPFSGSDDGLAVGGQGSFGLTLFGRRIVDDDAPPSLQPYLQRAAQLHVDGGGGGLSFSRDASSSLAGNTRTTGFADLNASGYLERFYAYLGIGAHYLSQSSGQFTSLTLPIDVAAGVRFGDARLLLGYDITPARYGDGIFDVAFWGGVYARAYGVVGRRLSLGAGVAVREGGVAADGDATIYLARRLGVGGNVFGSHGRVSALHYSYDEAGGGVSVDAWTGARFAVALACSFDWTRYVYDAAPVENDYTTVIALSFRLRPR